MLHLDNESITFRGGEMMVIITSANHLFEASSKDRIPKE